MNRFMPEKQAGVIAGLVEGMSVRSVERMVGVHRETITRLAFRVGKVYTSLLDDTMRDLRWRHLELDEVWCLLAQGSGSKPILGQACDGEASHEDITWPDHQSRRFLSHPRSWNLTVVQEQGSQWPAVTIGISTPESCMAQACSNSSCYVCCRAVDLAAAASARTLSCQAAGAILARGCDRMRLATANE